MHTHPHFSNVPAAHAEALKDTVREYSPDEFAALPENIRRQLEARGLAPAGDGCQTGTKCPILHAK
jgi:hypothetical protein